MDHATPKKNDMPLVNIPAAPLAPHEADLHHCDNCETDLVHPVGWSRIGDDAWALELRCPNCWGHSSGVFTQTEVDALEAKLDADEDILVDDMLALEQERIEDEIERFSGALASGAILPEDF